MSEAGLRRPNVLLITTDQQRRDTLGCYGNRVIRTPHLDRLAAEGVRFDRAYVANPVCTPSRATLLTGRYPSSHGAYNVGVALPEQVPTLSGMLGAAGYDTALIGKAHFQPFGGDPARFVESNRGAARDRALWREWRGPYYGFEHVELSMGHGPGGTEGHYGEWLRETAPEVLELFPRAAALAPSSVPIGSWKSAVPVEYHSTTWTAERTIAYMEERGREGRGERPFFVWASFQDPHHPFCPPRPYCDLYAPEEVPLARRRAGDLDDLAPHFRHAYEGTQDTLPYAGGRLSGTDPQGYAGMSETHAREVVAHYYGMVSLIDDAVGQILEALERLRGGAAEETVVVFGTDHGELLGDHGLWLKGPFLYEGLIRVPYVWRWPGGFPAGRVVSGVTSYLDFAPTVLELARVSPDSQMQGTSMAGLLRGETEEGPRGYAVVELREDVEGLQARTLVTERYKLTCYPGFGFGELFDLQEDPGEERNLWGWPGHAGTREELLRALVGAMADGARPVLPRLSYA